MGRPAGAPNQSQGVFSLVLRIRKETDGNFDSFVFESTACGSLIPEEGVAPCNGNLEFDRPLNLEPGVYQLELEIQYNANGSATLQYNSDLSFALGPPPECDLTWNDFDTGGLFGDENNWSPPQSPRDDGAGCDNLLIDRTGAFTVGVSGLQRANRLTLRSGDIRLQSVTGGTLQFSAAEESSPFGLLIGEGAHTTLDGVNLDTNGVTVGEGGTGKSTLTVSGAGSRLRSRGLTSGDVSDKPILAGQLEDGQIEVLGGASVSASEVLLGNSLGAGFPESAGLMEIRGGVGDSRSTVAVTDQVVIGNTGDGIVRVVEGGLLQTAGVGLVQVGEFGSGELSVAGVNPVNSAPSLAEIGFLQIGAGSGDLATVTISSNGQLTCDSVRLGEDGPATMFVENRGRVEVANSLRMNPKNQSLLEIASGGRGGVGQQPRRRPGRRQQGGHCPHCRREYRRAAYPRDQCHNTCRGRLWHG